MGLDAAGAGTVLVYPVVQGRGALIRFADISLGSGGCVRCTRCHGSAEEPVLRDAADVIAEVETVAASWEGAPGPNVTFGGAEPFSHPALPDIVAAAVRAKVQRVRLETDAVALGHPDNAAAVVTSGVRHVRVTLLGGSPGLHDALVGVPGALERTLAGINGLAEAAKLADVEVAASARVQVCRHNLRDVPAAVSAAADAGARMVLLAIDDDGLDLRTAAPWLEAACETAMVNRRWCEVEVVPYCLARGWALHLAPTYRPVEGAKPPSCDECELTSVCPGGIPVAAPDVMSAFKRPSNADELAAAVARGFAAPRGEASKGA
jgi:hypothetical protein